MKCLFGHKYEPIIAKVHIIINDNGSKGGQVTKVIMKCRNCGKIDFKTIDGAWTLKELRGEIPAPKPCEEE